MHVHVPTTIMTLKNTGGSTTTTTSTNEPTTFTNDFPMTENISTTTIEDTKETSTITDTQRSTTDVDNIVIVEVEARNQNNMSTSLITGAAIGGILTGVLITVLATLVVVTVAKLLSKKRESTPTLLAVSRADGGEEDRIKDIEMNKYVEDPVYSVVLPNPAAAVAGDYEQVEQVNVKKNECYGTLRA